MLVELAGCCTSSEGEEHKAHLNVWIIIKEKDKHIEMMFDGTSCSTAVFQLMAWKKFGLLNEEKESKFSPEIQELLKKWGD